MNKYQMVRKIGEVFTHSSSPADGLNRVTRLIATSLKVWCSLYSYDSKNETLTVVSAYGAKGSSTEHSVFSASSGLVGMAVRRNAIFNFDDAVARSEFHPVPGFEDTPETEPHGALIVPLRAAGRTIGAIVLSRRKKGEFPLKVVALIREIAPPLALFIINNEILLNTNSTHFSLQEPRHEEKPRQNDQLLSGTPITRGVVFGQAIIVSGVNKLLDIEKLPQPVLLNAAAKENEKKLLFAAMDMVRTTCRKTAQDLSQILAEADCDIFEMHAMMVDDPTLQNSIINFIDEGHDITTALAGTLRIFSEKYRKIQDETLRERLYDIKDVLLNLKNAADNIRGAQVSNPAASAHEPKNVIIVATELLPSQLVSFPLKKVSGIICEEGGATSHVAILARALQITMMVGIPDICENVRPHDSILLDCDAGKLLLRPTLSMMRNYSTPLKLTQQLKSQPPQTSSGKIIQAKTADGVPVMFAGNLALLCEIPPSRYYGIGEIGLYRTEFMFMLKSELPSEGEQCANFRKILETAGGVPVTIRLLDAGGDKPIPYLDCWQNEQNPAMGWRGLRFLLSNPSILQPHLRAILRATAYGDVRILVPMVADLYDLMQIKQALATAENELRQQGIPFAPDYKVGVMLEIPSAIYALDEMMPHIDFVSIGTNDLVQFMFAIDRGNQQVRKWYRQCNPIILKVIHQACKIVAKYPGKYISLCGELAGIRRMLPVLLGAGLRRLSMAPARIPELRDVAAKFTIPQCEAIFNDIIANCHSEMDVIDFLKTKGID